MSALAALASKIRSYPALAAAYLTSRFDALEASVSGLAADGGPYTCPSGAVAGNAVYVSGADTVALADADDTSKIPAVGVVVSKPTSTTCNVRFAGVVTGLSGLTAGAMYYLSTTAGALTTTAPSAPHAAPIGVAISTTKLLVAPLGILSDLLRAVTATGGANVVGYDDSGSKTSAATVADALDELYTDRLTTSRSVSINLGMFREVNATGDVLAVAAIGGVLASDTAPILRADANNDWEIFWAAANVDPIGVQLDLPPDFDGTGNAILELDVGSGSTDAATMSVRSSWNGGSEITDSADDSGTKSATVHTITATIAAADIADTAKRVSLRLIPPTHATDGITLKRARLTYTPKLLT